MKTLELKTDKLVKFQILGTQKTDDIDIPSLGKRPCYEMCVKIDGEMFIFTTCSQQLMSQFVLLVRDGYSPNGTYKILKTGIGVNTRYKVTPLHNPRPEPKASFWQRAMSVIGGLWPLQWKQATE